MYSLHGEESEEVKEETILSLNESLSRLPAGGFFLKTKNGVYRNI